MLAHGRVLLEENQHTRFVAADIRDPDQLLVNPAVGELLDFTQPIGLLHAGVLHHIRDDEDPVATMRGYVTALASGSYVAISHFHNPEDNSDVAEAAEQAEHVLAGGDLGSGRFRSPHDIHELFAGLPLLEPGLVPLAEWWPLGPPERPLAVPRQLMLGGLATNPRPTGTCARAARTGTPEGVPMTLTQVTTSRGNPRKTRHGYDLDTVLAATTVGPSSAAKTVAK